MNAQREDLCLDTMGGAGMLLTVQVEAEFLGLSPGKKKKKQTPTLGEVETILGLNHSLD